MEQQWNELCTSNLDINRRLKQAFYQSCQFMCIELFLYIHQDTWRGIIRYLKLKYDNIHVHAKDVAE